jgi:hypothetical protein
MRAIARKRWVIAVTSYFVLKGDRREAWAYAPTLTVIFYGKIRHLALKVR